MERWASIQVSVALGLLALGWGGVWAAVYDEGLYHHDVDGWAEKVTDWYPNRLPVAELFRGPSLWKGPIIPTLYHASYVVWPSVYSPIVFNVLGFGFAAFLLHRILVRAGLHPVAVTLGVALWAVYPPFRYLYSMYFAEPVIAALSAILLGLVVHRPERAFVAGLCAGVLLLGRPPFLLVVALIPPIQFAAGQRRRAIAFCLGAALTFLPWGIRNYVVTGVYVPFTVEGGQTLFHGSYLPLDDVHWQTFKEDPEVAKLEKAAPKEPVLRMKYLAGLAKEQVLADPLGQCVRSLRKAQRFWMEVDADTFVPIWKTGLAAAVLLPLAAVGAWRNRRVPVLRWMLVWIFGLWAMHAAVFGILRYSYPVFPLMTVLAAGAVWPARQFIADRNA
jgi:hypothetical protein